MNTKVIQFLLPATLLLLASVGTGCVPMWTGDEMQQEIEAIKAEQNAMQENYDAEKTKLTEMIASARQDVVELKDVLKEARALLQRNNADLGVEIQKTREEMSELRGQIEQMEFKLAKLEQDLKLFKEDVDLRFADGSMSLPEEAVPLFEHGKKAYDAGKYRDARKAFEKFGEKFATHGKAAEAQYLLGMTFFNENQWVTSVFEFQKVVEKHGKSTRVDDATYHIGAALMKMGRCEQAKQWFQLVVDDYGNSEWASEARQKINAVKSGNCS
ncbi:tetratricopeptide repeat protein [Persicimonas caeni]|uniref:Tetratricopeptide repeat protein n=1 Tax=Persicimonas caeni TaxID=2292766 RepID=A0A4Y6PM08_PERCE|nr:tetratricopeptide repeat protein [Persicimonas caeni]QDG49259.1 tetratricopeptide repeat protein [Persicimonas caeni]QED30480.1 tetratricopeptide repeat protein [Persicimonas caeni]